LAAADGGGMSSRGHPTVTNCTFSGNSADSGGGMSNTGNPLVTNCTFSGNLANTGGGLISIGDSFVQPTPVLQNCVLWGNTPDQIVDSSGAVTTVGNSEVQGAWAGVDNIDAPPLFARNPYDGGDGWGDDPSTLDVDEGANDDFGDLQLRFGSPCINVGNNAALPPDVADLDGDGDVLEAMPHDLDSHARVLCGVVDMGAYESGIGDDDCDGNVDLNDFGSWESCISGPGGGPLAIGCESFDFDGDDDVDSLDFGAFQIVFDGSP